MNVDIPGNMLRIPLALLIMIYKIHNRMNKLWYILHYTLECYAVRKYTRCRYLHQLGWISQT